LKEKGYQARKNEDAVTYNKAAMEVVKEYSLPVDDLYSFIYNSPEMKELYTEDGVHHNSKGCIKIGKKVAVFIMEYIQTKIEN
jgi:lysophospholipase L1-like esterase